MYPARSQPEPGPPRSPATPQEVDSPKWKKTAAGRREEFSNLWKRIAAIGTHLHTLHVRCASVRLPWSHSIWVRAVRGLHALVAASPPVARHAEAVRRVRTARPAPGAVVPAALVGRRHTWRAHVHPHGGLRLREHAVATWMTVLGVSIAADLKDRSARFRHRSRAGTTALYAVRSSRRRSSTTLRGWNEQWQSQRSWEAS